MSEREREINDTLSSMMLSTCVCDCHFILFVIHFHHNEPTVGEEDKDGPSSTSIYSVDSIDLIMNDAPVCHIA